MLDATAYGPTAQRRPFAEITTIPEPVIPGESVLNLNVFTPDPTRIEASAAVWAGVFNASIALGSLAGGQIVDRAGNHAVLVTAAGLTAAGLLVTALTRPGGGSVS